MLTGSWDEVESKGDKKVTLEGGGERLKQKEKWQEVMEETTKEAEPTCPREKKLNLSIPGS